MTFEPVLLEHTFTGPIGVDVGDDVWTCVEMPGSAEFFGTKKSVRCDVVVDDLELPNTGFMITGRGGHMLSLNAGNRKKLGKDLGDSVTVRLVRRVK